MIENSGMQSQFPLSHHTRHSGKVVNILADQPMTALGRPRPPPPSFNPPHSTPPSGGGRVSERASPIPYIHHQIRSGHPPCGLGFFLSSASAQANDFRHDDGFSIALSLSCFWPFVCQIDWDPEDTLPREIKPTEYEKIFI